MNVLVVSGIWPPDVGGPASHAPDVADWLHERGHEVEVVTTASSEPDERPYAVHWVPRALRKGLIHIRAAGVVRKHALAADVVYTTGMYGRSTAGALFANTPFVAKLTGDPAFERARARGLVEGAVAEFQNARGLRVAILTRARDAELRRAAHVYCPSVWLRELVLSWGVAADRVSILRNPAPSPDGLPSREELRRRLDFAGPTVAFAGRLTAQKAVELAVEAIANVPGVDFAIAGEGPDRERLERLASSLNVGDRIRFLGTLPREEVLALLRAADAAILSSAWENFPHMVVEALAVGTPVLASKAGGVAEVVRHGENGLLVEPGDPPALAAAMRSFFADEAMRTRLRAAAAPSVAPLSRDWVFGELEARLAASAQTARPEDALAATPAPSAP